LQRTEFVPVRTLGAPSTAAKMNAAEGSPRDDYSLEAERKIRKLFAVRAINLR
jgi:hypothetical protein